MVTIDKIKELREQTGISIGECRKALLEAKGDIVKAKEILKKLGKSFAQKKGARETREGIIEAYIHPGRKVGAMVELNCESDFVAKSADFQKLAHELCLQVAASGEEKSLPEQPWIKDESRTIKDLLDEYIGKFGENIVIKKFTRYEI